MKMTMRISALVAALLIPAVTFAGNIIPRTVVVESFTATWCGYCPLADAAIEQIMEEDTDCETVLVEYHVSDVFSNNDGNARHNYYGQDGTPSVLFDGLSRLTGVYLGQDMYDHYRPRVDARRNYDSPAIIHADVTKSANSWRVQGRIDVVETIWQSTPRFRIALTEDDLVGGGRHYNGTLRDMALDIPLSGKRVGDVTFFDTTISISGSWKADDLNVVTFVQEDTWGEILAAKQIADIIVDVQGSDITVDRGGLLQFDVAFKNTTPTNANQKLWFKAFSRNGNQVGPDPIYGPLTVSCPANQTTVESISYQLPPRPQGSFQVAAWAGPTMNDATDYDTFDLTIQP